MMCQCGSVATNVPLWWRMLTMRGTMHMWEERVYETSLYFPFDFSVNEKLL